MHHGGTERIVDFKFQIAEFKSQ